MTALTANRYTKHRDGLITAHPVKASARIYKGSLVCADSTGHAVPGADTANFIFLGVALEEANNTGGANAAIYVRVQAYGVFSFAASGSLTQADVGKAAYILDDQTIALAATTTNDIKCGRIEGLDSGAFWIRIAL